MTPDAILANGGIGGLIVAVAMAGKLGLDWWKDRHDLHNRDALQELTKGTAAVTDANAANAIVLASLKAVHEESGRLTAKVAALEEQGAEKDAKIAALENQNDTKDETIRNLGRQVGDLREQLDSLAQRLAELGKA